jgi:hypothetical protein
MTLKRPASVTTISAAEAARPGLGDYGRLTPSLSAYFHTQGGVEAEG